MKQETYTASAIRHLAPAVRTDIVAVALFERSVSLWDISTGGCMSEFETVLDFGGTRLILSQEESACLAAAYRVHGLACYDTPSGCLRWQRRDLKKIQQLAIAPDGRRAYCCFDDGQCQVISISTGDTKERIRAVRRVWVDLRGAFQLRESSKLTVVDSGGEEAFRIKPGSFAVLGASFSQDHLAISESGTDVRVFELSTGREVAHHIQPKNSHVLKLSSSPDGFLFYGIQWNYNKGGPKKLLRFGPDSQEPEVVRNLGQPAEVAFCHEGRQLLTSEGLVVECQSGQTVKQLQFPQKEYPID